MLFFPNSVSIFFCQIIKNDLMVGLGVEKVGKHWACWGCAWCRTNKFSIKIATKFPKVWKSKSVKIQSQNQWKFDFNSKENVNFNFVSAMDKQTNRQTDKRANRQTEKQKSTRDAMAQTAERQPRNSVVPSLNPAYSDSIFWDQFLSIIRIVDYVISNK